MKKNNLLKNSGVQSLIASVLCILVGLLVGYIALLIINAEGAWKAISTICKNFMYYPSKPAQIKYLGNTLVKTAPLLMCALSVLFANKAGLFNIGAAGQYVVGAGASLYMALALNLPWWACLLGAILAGALLGALSGYLKTKFNVNEVISCIMFNWISLYCVNMLLSKVKETTSPYTLGLKGNAPQALIPGMGFNGIAAAFLGGLHPVGSVFSSFFIQHITAGGAYVDKTLYCAQVSDFISSLIIYLCGFVLFMKTAMNRSLDKADEKRKAKKLEGGKK